MLRALKCDVSEFWCVVIASQYLISEDVGMKKAKYSIWECLEIMYYSYNVLEILSLRKYAKG